MPESQANLGGFNRPRPTEDPYITRMYDKLGIGIAPSLENIEPHAINMMRDGYVLEGMGLALGRRIDAMDTDADLRDIFLVGMHDPEQAFGGLLLKLTLEELEAEH